MNREKLKWQARGNNNNPEEPEEVREVTHGSNMGLHLYPGDT